jgi:protein subunit release factor B
MKKPIVSVTKDDCEWIYQRGSGNGGQKKNKTNSAVICTHKISRAQGYAEDNREQSRNRELAFKRMVETKKFQSWLKTETLKKLGVLGEIENNVDKQMCSKNIKVETQQNGKWVEENAN